LLQKRLLSLGYELPKWGADGEFGDETVEAVKSFQADNGLSPDGIVVINTWRKLLNL
jgi:N-acetylmuramoyl-L-alanine amidase